MLAHLNQLATHSPQRTGTLGPAQAKSLVLKKALASEDTLFHSALYNWYIEQGFVEELLQVFESILIMQMKSTYLETFLKSEQDNQEMAGLLWRFYVIHGRFTEAAIVLSELADAPGLDLNKRIEYLTMAVSNAKSASSTDQGTPNTILAQLTDSLDVARIQMEVYNHVNGLPGYENAKEELNARLLDVNEVHSLQNGKTNAIFSCITSMLGL